MSKSIFIYKWMQFSISSSAFPFNIINTEPESSTIFSFVTISGELAKYNIFFTMTTGLVGNLLKLHLVLQHMLNM